MNPPSLLLYLACGNTQAAERLRRQAISFYANASTYNPEFIAIMRHDEMFMWKMLMSSFYGAYFESMGGIPVTAPLSQRNPPPGTTLPDVNTYIHRDINHSSAYTSQDFEPAPLLAPIPTATPAYTVLQNNNFTPLPSRQYHDARPVFNDPFWTSSAMPASLPEIAGQSNGTNSPSFFTNTHQAHGIAERRTSRMSSVLLQDTYNSAHDTGYTNLGNQTLPTQNSGYTLPQQHNTAHDYAPSHSRQTSLSRVPSTVPSYNTPRDIYSPLPAPPARLPAATAPRRPSTQVNKSKKYNRRPCPNGNWTCKKPNELNNGTTVWQQTEFVSHYLQDHIPHMAHLRVNGYFHCEFSHYDCLYTSVSAKELAKHVFQTHRLSESV